MRLADLERRMQTYEEASDFVKGAAVLMTSPGIGEAEQKAQSLRLNERVQRVVKAAVSGGMTDNVGLTDYGPAVGSFMTSLAAVGAFDRLAAGALKLPVRPGRVVINSTVLVASEVDEAKAKPIKAITLQAEDFTARKILVQIVLSRPLIDALGEEGLRALEKELRASTAVGTDLAFLDELTTSNSFEGDSTASFDVMLSDLEELTRNVDLGATSRPFFITTQSIAKAWQKLHGRTASPLWG
jgi:hypothetical protein